MTHKNLTISSLPSRSARRLLRASRCAQGVLCAALLLTAVSPAAAQKRRKTEPRRPRDKTVEPAKAQQTTSTPDPEAPPGEVGALPSTMDKIAQAADVTYQPKPGAYRVRFNLEDADLAELVNHISGMTGRRFIYGAKVRSIKATVVSPEPVTLDEAYQAFLSILEVNGLTVVPHGRFLKIVDSAGVTAQGTPVYSRGEPVPNTDSFLTRIYRTRFVSADEAAALLNKFKSKEADISTYPSGNLLIITDTGSQVQRMVRILEEIDVGGAGQKMWIEPINHGDAAELAERVNELFDVTQGGGGGLTKVVADEQTNALIVVGTDDSYEKLLQVIRRLDSRPGESGGVHVLPLQHAVADELSKTLQQMLTGQTGRKKGGPAGGDGGGMFDGAVTVTPDQATNSLVVSSSPRDFAQLRVLVDQLDRPRRQVFIEAVIMDVAVSDVNDLGFSWHGGAQEDFGTMLGGFNAATSATFPDVSALQGFAAGVRGPDLAGTSQYTPTGLSIPAFGVVVNALATSGRGNVLATPHIIATDNVAAEIQVGENIPLQTNVGGGFNQLSALGAGGAVAAGNLASAAGFGFNAPRETVGNKIKVTPHINESDQVRLEIEQESSAPGAPVGALGAVPIIKRTAETTVVVRDQQTIVIGGLTRDEFTTSRDKVPVLGDIPVLGFLFSRTKTTKRKSNLLLILTPHVIREQSDLRRIFERKMQERQEFLDRYFVFQTDSWAPPTDYTRANGLVEAIRQAYFDVAERKRLEEELRPRELHEHTPSEPIDLPAGVKPSKGGAAPARSAPAPRPAPPPPPAQGKNKGRGEVDGQEAPDQAPEVRTASIGEGAPLRVAPLPRSVIE